MFEGLDLDREKQAVGLGMGAIQAGEGELDDQIRRRGREIASAKARE